MKHCVMYIAFLITIFVTTVHCQRWGAPQSGAKYTSKGAYGFSGDYSSSGMTPQPAYAKSQQMTRSTGIGAWGYVGIILSVIMTGLGIYYFAIFYPIFCKKERKYDVMEMTAV